MNETRLSNTCTFDYAVLPPGTAASLRLVADVIRGRVKNAVVEITEIGSDLLAAKELVPHGQFGRWLAAEFEWSERQARNFMNVAEWLEDKTARIADLAIQPTAAYILAAPSVPCEARESAIERAEAGEVINGRVAQEIVSKARKNKKAEPSPEKLSTQLDRTLERYLEKWPDDKRPDLARQLRDFADDVDGDGEETGEAT